jgi:hypothetical protein
LISLNFVSAAKFYGGDARVGSRSSDSGNSDSIYNWRYQGPANEPSTSYYSNVYYSSGYVPISARLKTFNGPYTQVHQQNTQPYPRPVSTPSPSSNNFQAGGGYTPSLSFEGDSYTYYGGYGGYYGYGYSYYPISYGYDYYSDYYPGYYW